MFGIGSKPATTDTSNQSSALAQIRQALSSSKNGSNVKSNVPLLESGKALENAPILTHKLGNADVAYNNNTSTSSAYSMLPMWLFSWKSILIAIILFAIIYVIRPYISMFNDITSMINTVLGSTKDDIGGDALDEEMDKETEEEPKKKRDGYAKINDKVQGQQRKKAPVLMEDPKPDESARSTQGGSQGGFCLAGEWKGVRSCVKVDSKTDCTSGQLFASEATCVSPKMRP
jgi:hypothetical protein